MTLSVRPTLSLSSAFHQKLYYFKARHLVATTTEFGVFRHTTSKTSRDAIYVFKTPSYIIFDALSNAAYS